VVFEMFAVLSFGFTVLRTIQYFQSVAFEATKNSARRCCSATSQRLANLFNNTELKDTFGHLKK
jgi:hypothetical protein